MEGPIIAAMVVAAPLILLPVALVWYLNIAGIAEAHKGRETEAAKEPKRAGAKVKAGG